MAPARRPSDLLLADRGAAWYSAAARFPFLTGADTSRPLRPCSHPFPGRVGSCDSCRRPQAMSKAAKISSQFLTVNTSLSEACRL